MRPRSGDPRALGPGGWPEARRSHPRGVALAAGLATSVALKLKCQLVPPRLHMSQNSAAQSMTCVTRWEAEISNRATVSVCTKEPLPLCGLAPAGPLSHDAWERGLLQTSSILTSLGEAFFVCPSLQNNPATCRGW